MFGLLPLLFALTIAETSTRMDAPFAALHGWPQLLGAVGGSLLVWLVLGEVAARIIATRGKRRWLGRWDLLTQSSVIVWYAWVCYGWGWTLQSELMGVRFFTVALAPWVLMQAVHWWTLTVAVRRVSGHNWSRFGLVLQQFRFGVLPMLLILPLFDLGALIAVKYDLEHAWFSGAWGALLAVYLAQGFMVLMLLILPLALLPLWGAQRMPPGEMQRLMLRACERLGVRVAGLMRWPMSGGRVYNAAVIGMLPRLRYVLFTDDLMRDLPPPQVMAVLGHELGHARHGHLWLYVLFANAGLLLSFLLREPFAAVLMPFFDNLLLGFGVVSSTGQIQSLAEITAALLMMALLWRVAFGYLSRACERQADLAGAELAGDPQVMCDALKSVAQLSGQGEDEPSWRHYTIAQRVAFLRAVRQRPEIATRHHQLVRMMRHSLILVIIALLLAASYLFDPRRDAMTGDPQQQLNEWVKTDRELGEALTAADRGDHLPLAVWLNRAEDPQRERVALLTLRQIERDTGVDSEGDPRFDDRPSYRWRHRLLAFQQVITGDRDIDLILDNTLAYGLVAGTTEPTRNDLEVARSVLPRLVKQVTANEGNHGLQDTVGCVHFALGDYAKAVTSFETALKRFEASTRESASWLASEADRRRAGKLRTHLQALYSRRLDAARSNAEKVAAGTAPDDPGLLPLPRDLGQPLPVPTTPGVSAVEATGSRP